MSNIQTEARQELARRELARRNYSDYLPYALGETFRKTKMAMYLARQVQSFLETPSDSSYDILIIHTPPQHGKSLTISESLVSWYLGKNPKKNVIMASYDSEFAEKFCRRNKEKIKAVGGKLFNISIGGIDRATEFELSSGGRFIARGIMSGITGNAADLIIIDDPIKNRQEADSLTYRDRLWEEWQNSLKSRLAAGGKVIVIMTPWHEDDFAGRLIKAEKNVTVLRLPVEAEENDPLGRKPGEALCPEIGKDNEWLRDFKESYINDPMGGQRAWQALYMCSPRCEEGGLVQRSWWKYYNPAELPEFGTQLISVDTSFKDGDTNDFCAIEVWGKAKQDYYLLYCENRHLNFPDTIAEIKRVQALYPEARQVLIEEASNGVGIIQILAKEMQIIPIQPRSSKASRVNAVSSMIESGHVYLPNPENTPWVAQFVDQFSVFPNGAHDDMVDSASQALARLLYSNGEPYEARPEKKARWNIFDAYRRA